MKTVGVFEAKTKLTALLEQVARGEQVTITKHGTPVARLVPVERRDRDRVKDAIARLKRFSRHQTLGGLSLCELRSQGRP
jgi:prevent-host-death family protein